MTCANWNTPPPVSVHQNVIGYSNSPQLDVATITMLNYRYVCPVIISHSNYTATFDTRFEYLLDREARLQEKEQRNSTSHEHRAYGFKRISGVYKTEETKDLNISYVTRLAINRHYIENA